MKSSYQFQNNVIFVNLSIVCVCIYMYISIIDILILNRVCFQGSLTTCAITLFLIDRCDCKLTMLQGHHRRWRDASTLHYA